jgi:hypothetical protein
VTRDSTAIADRMAMGAGPFAHGRRVQGTAAAAPSLRRRRLIGGLRGRAGSTGSTTLAQPPTGSGQLTEVGLAQVEFVAGGAVVHSNRRHGLGAVTVKIADKHDTCCLGHNSSVQRHTSNGPLARNPKQQRSIHIPSQRLTTSRGSDALAEEHRQVDDDPVQEARVDALRTLSAAPTPTMPSPATAAARATALSMPSVTKVNGASSRDQPSDTFVGDHEDRHASSSDPMGDAS